MKHAEASGANTSIKSRMAGVKIADAREALNAAKESGDEAAMQDARGVIDRQKNKIYGNLDNFDASAMGAGNKAGRNKISRMDIVELEKRHGKEAVLDYVKENSQGARVGGKAQKLLDKYTSSIKDGNKDGGTPPGDTNNPSVPGDQPGAGDTTNPPGNTGGTGGAGGGGNAGGQAGPGTTGSADQTVKQNNDNTVKQGGTTGNVSVGGDNSGTIDNSITNNNNQQIDNSVMQFGRGGDRVMNINGAAGQTTTQAVDGVATAGTLGGMWDVDDSMAAQGKMIAGYDALNRQLQKPYEGAGGEIANKYIQNAAATNPIDYEALDAQIQGRQIYHQDQATLQENKTMGDSWKFTPSDYKMPNALEHQDFSDSLGEATSNAHDEIDDV